MLSAILILALSITAILVAWSVLARPRENRGSSRDALRESAGYHQQGPDLDLQILRALLNPDEFHYLQRSLTRQDFKDLQRKRIRLTFEVLRLLEDKLDRPPAVEPFVPANNDRKLAPEAQALLASTVELRFNLLLARFCLCLQWLFPSGPMSLPYCFWPYLLNKLQLHAVTSSV